MVNDMNTDLTLQQLEKNYLLHHDCIIGLNVVLRPIQIFDTNNIIKWRNQDDIKAKFIFRGKLTREMHINWLKNEVFCGKCVQYIIVDKKTDVSIGSIYLRDIDQVNKKTEYGIYIGEAGYRGKGIGTEASILLIEYAFNTLHMNKIFLRVLAENQIAIKSYQRVGFVKEGLFTEDFFADGQYKDVVFMAVLRRSFAKTTSDDGV